MKSLLDDFAAEVTQSTETLDEQKVTPLHLGYVGKAVKRKEDLPLITGTSCFVGDMSLPRQLHMRVVRSPVAHGKIIDIDASAALEAPGVVAVWTHHDVADIPPIPFRETKVQGLQPYRQPILAKEYVRYVGEPVAVVFADDAYRAEDAAELVFADIEQLPAITDALTPPQAFDANHSTEPVILRKGYGDVDQAFKEADEIVELELNVGRHTAVPMETRGALARYNASRDHLEIYGATKRPHWNRDQLAEMLDRSPSSIDIYEIHVGGGFGVRGELYPEDVLVCLGALRLNRPVKWIEDRREHLMSCNHSREQTHHIAAAVDKDGHILGIDEKLYHDQGGYIRTHGARVADLSLGLLLGPYEVPAYRAVGHFRLTNKTPAATYRAPGRFEGTFVRERLLDAIAAKLHMDPIEVRRRNLIPSESMPYDRSLDALETQVVYDSGDYQGLLDKTLKAVDWDGMKQEAAQRRAQGEAVGVGLGMFVEKSGLGPCDGVRVTVDVTGRVDVVTGAASLGQGVETVLAQICADALGADYEQVLVHQGQTDRIAHGIGSHASRTTVMTGSATQVAAQKVKKYALEVAAEMHAMDVSELDIVQGYVVRADNYEQVLMTLAQVAQELRPEIAIRKNREPGLTALGWFHSEGMNYPYGIHVAQVCIDKETGDVSVEKYYIAYDIGRAVNPMLVDGQLIGGLAQGIGGALFEEFIYDAQGQPLSVTFADYVMPSVNEMPQVETLISEDAPSPLNPLGLKGAGEGGVNAVGAAVASAIDDALQRPGLISRLPVTPQRLHELLRQEKVKA